MPGYQRATECQARALLLHVSKVGHPTGSPFVLCVLGGMRRQIGEVGTAPGGLGLREPGGTANASPPVS